MRKGKNIDHSQDIDYNDDTNSDEGLLLELYGFGGLKIQIWNVDYQHALAGHPEVSIERIKEALMKPVKVIKSQHSERVCLFYNLEIKDDPVFGNIYFCVVVGVMGNGVGKMETAYETTYIKKGQPLFPQGESK